MTARPTRLARLTGAPRSALGSTSRKVTVDDAYIAESIRAPQAKARPSYPPSMPVFDVSTVKPNEIAALTAYIRSLK